MEVKVAAAQSDPLEPVPGLITRHDVCGQLFKIGNPKFPAIRTEELRAQLSTSDVRWLTVSYSFVPIVNSGDIPLLGAQAPCLAHKTVTKSFTKEKCEDRLRTNLAHGPMEKRARLS